MFANIYNRILNSNLNLTSEFNFLENSAVDLKNIRRNIQATILENAQ